MASAEPTDGIRAHGDTTLGPNLTPSVTRSFKAMLAGVMTLAVTASPAFAHDGGVVLIMAATIVVPLIPGALVGALSGLFRWRLVLSAPCALASFLLVISLIERLHVAGRVQPGVQYEHYIEDLVFLGSIAIVPFLIVYATSVAIGGRVRSKRREGTIQGMRA